MTQNTPTVDETSMAAESADEGQGAAPSAHGAVPAPPHTPRLPLTRSVSDRKVAGVAGGLGRYAGVDPLIFRIVLVVLALFGGSGFVVYGLGWLFIPADGQAESEAQRLTRGRGTLRVLAVGALAIVGLAIFLDSFAGDSGSGGLVALSVVGLAAYLVLRSDGKAGRGGPTTENAPHGAASTSGPPVGSGVYGQTPGTAYADALTAPLPPYYGPPPPPTHVSTGFPPPPPPPPPRERSMLGRLTFSAVLLVVGVLLAIRAGTDALAITVIPAAALLTVGIGLLFGAVYGRSRWLILLGVVLTLATAVTAVADSAADDGIGVRKWAPQSVSQVQPSYQLGIGEATLDLREVSPAPGERLVIEAGVGIGELRVMAPSDANLEITGETTAGAVWMPGGGSLEGLNEGPFKHFQAGSTAAGTIELDLRVGLGSLWVQQ